MTTAILLAVSFLNFFETRNTIANFILEPPEPGKEVQSEKPDLMVRSNCPACAGAGELVLEEPDYGQSAGRLGSKNKKTKKQCPLCHGSGRHVSYVDPSELAMQVARDRDAFVSAHQGRGEIPVGLAFVPQALYDGADKKRLKLVENAFGKPCKCNWTGLEKCRKCSGRGTIPCTNKDCKGGWEVTTTTTSVSETRSRRIGNSGCSRASGIRSGGSRSHTRKETKTSVRGCPVCGGAKMLPCPECAGQKASVCTKCAGLGYKQAKGM